MVKPVLLGSHVSVSGGIHTAFERATRAGCTTMQVFVKNASQWEGKPLTGEDVENYKSAEAKATVAPVLAHAAYLINLAARPGPVLRRSRLALEDELRRCERLEIRGLIVHPGAHGGSGEDEGVKRIAESINTVHARTPGFLTRTVLETTAGQGTSVGYRFEQLAAIIERVEARPRVGVCLDTCHLFASGYAIHTEQGWEETLRALEEILGLELLVAVHVNDSRRGFGERIDRHEHIGKGRIGTTAFRMLMNDHRLSGLPKILETEKSPDMHEDVENMTFLRSLITPS